MYKKLLSKYVSPQSLGSPLGSSMKKIKEGASSTSRKPPAVPRLQLKVKYPAIEADEEILKLLADQ